MDDWVVNAAYVSSFLALAVRDVLRLRVLLLAAQVLFLWWGFLIANTPTMAWNAAFLAINAAMIGRILWERRPIEIPAEFADIYNRVFPGMRPRDFLLFLEMGNPHRAENAVMVHEGELPKSLKMVLSGDAQVVRDGETVASIGRGGFVAELSLLTGKPASADVRADAPVEYVAWSRRKLDNLESINPDLYIAIQKALGRDVSRKVMER